MKKHTLKPNLQNNPKQRLKKKHHVPFPSRFRLETIRTKGKLFLGCHGSWGREPPLTFLTSSLRQVSARYVRYPTESKHQLVTGANSQTVGSQ